MKLSKRLPLRKKRMTAFFLPTFLLSVLFFAGDSFAAKWLPLPATSLHGATPPNNFGGSSYSYSSKSYAVTRAWSGGAWDDANRTMYVWGGGHGDYAGNEVYKIDLSLSSGVTTTRITDPDVDSYTDSASPNCTDEVPGTNNPVARHTYGNLAFLPAASTGLSEDMIWAFGGSRVCGSGGFGNDTWTFGISSKTWTKKNPTGSGPGAIILFAAYHPGNNKIYMTGAESSGTNALFYAYNVATNTFSTLYTFNPWVITGLTGSRNATLVGNDYYFMGGGGIWKINVNGSPNYQPQKLSTTGDTEIENAKAPGAAYDSKRGTLVAWDGWNPTYMYSLNLSSNVWTKTQVTANAPLSGTTWSGGDITYYSGVFGRFAYSSKMDCYVVVQDSAQNAALYCPDDYPTDLWFGRTIPSTSHTNNCESGQCKHIRMAINPNDNLIWSFGGDHGSGSANSDIYTYNVDTDTWTTKLPYCATDGVVQFDGLDEGPLFFANNKFYYHNAGNYCSQYTTGIGLSQGPPWDCGPLAIYESPHISGHHGYCANSTMYSGRFMPFDPSNSTWSATFLTLNPWYPSATHWMYYDQTLNAAFSTGGSNGNTIYKYDVATDSWTSKNYTMTGTNYTTVQSKWAQDVSKRALYNWDSYTGHGYVYKYDMASDQLSKINSSGPTASGGYNQYQLSWDSQNSIIHTVECNDNQSFPMKYHTFKPALDGNSGTWTQNITYNTWNTLKPYGRESIYDSVHNLYIIFGTDEGTYGNNQMWFYRYGGGAGTKPNDTTPPLNPKGLRKTTP